MRITSTASPITPSSLWRPPSPPHGGRACSSGAAKILGLKEYGLKPGAPMVYAARMGGVREVNAHGRLDNLPLSIADNANAERWQKVLNALNSGDMPPEDQKQPPANAKADFLEDLATVMVVARRNLAETKGVLPMRRLNQREYGNTLRELLGVTINVSELPNDKNTAGFDTADGTDNRGTAGEGVLEQATATNNRRIANRFRIIHDQNEFHGSHGSVRPRQLRGYSLLTGVLCRDFAAILPGSTGQRQSGAGRSAASARSLSLLLRGNNTRAHNHGCQESRKANSQELRYLHS